MAQWQSTSLAWNSVCKAEAIRKEIPAPNKALHFSAYAVGLGGSNEKTFEDKIQRFDLCEEAF